MACLATYNGPAVGTDNQPYTLERLVIYVIIQLYVVIIFLSFPILLSYKIIGVYVPHEGFNSANWKSQKWRVSAGSWKEATFVYFDIILTHITETIYNNNEVFFIKMNQMLVSTL